MSFARATQGLQPIVGRLDRVRVGPAQTYLEPLEGPSFSSVALPVQRDSPSTFGDFDSAKLTGLIVDLACDPPCALGHTNASAASFGDAQVL